MSVIQNEKAMRRALHNGSGAFVLPNPWDVGSAQILAGLALGRKDHELTRDEALAQARVMVEATDLPVSADLEKGFGDSPELEAETIHRAADVGLVGCMIEDATGNPDGPLYDLGLAVERIAAVAEAARALPFEFMLTAANPDLGETIGRLKAFEEVGADVLFASCLSILTRAACGALSKPFNFMAGIKGNSFSVSELDAVGVRRISLATSLYRTAMTGFQMPHAR